jgi:hypothetical protein
LVIPAWVVYTLPVELTHTGLGPARVGTGLTLTVIVIAFDVAGFPVTQERFDVKTHVIISPATGAYV